MSTSLVGFGFSMSVLSASDSDSLSLHMVFDQEMFECFLVFWFGILCCGATLGAAVGCFGQTMGLKVEDSLWVGHYLAVISGSQWGPIVYGRVFPCHNYYT